MSLKVMYSFKIAIEYLENTKMNNRANKQIKTFKYRRTEIEI